jgi:hypothetical protein
MLQFNCKLAPNDNGGDTDDEDHQRKSHTNEDC